MARYLRRFSTALCAMVSVWLTGSLPSAARAQAPQYLTQWGSYGQADGEFNGPFDVAVGAAGDVYVADFANHRIQKFTSAGAYVTQWGTYGSENGQFNSPVGVVVDANGSVYVADGGNKRIQKFTSTGDYLTQWGTPGSGVG